MIIYFFLQNYFKQITISIPKFSSLLHVSPLFLRQNFHSLAFHRFTLVVREDETEKNKPNSFKGMDLKKKNLQNAIAKVNAYYNSQRKPSL